MVYKNRKFKIFICTGFSALLFFSAFKIASLFWFSFLFLLPLFYGAVQQSISFLHGLVWGILFWSLHLYPILLVITEKLFLSWLWWIALVIYFALHAGLWFFCCMQFSRWSSYTLCSWLLATWCYFVFVDQAILWIFGSLEGYELAFPLLPLIQKPAFLFLLPYAGKYIVLLFLIAVQLLAVQCYKQKSRSSFFFLCMALLPFWIGFFLPKKVSDPPAWLDKIACASVVPAAHQSTWERLHALREAVERAKASNPRLILMPESTLPFCLDSDTKVLKFLKEYVVDDEMELILGAQYTSEEKTYNALYHLNDSGIKSIYGKRHGMMVVERLPWFLKVFLPYERCGTTFDQSIDKGQALETSLFHATPLLCSELFFSGYHNEGTLVLCLLNDSWFSSSYQHRLMQMAAQFNALCWQQDILYIAYSAAFFVNSSCHIFHLKHVHRS